MIALLSLGVAPRFWVRMDLVDWRVTGLRVTIRYCKIQLMTGFDSLLIHQINEFYMTRRCKQCKDVDLNPARQCTDIVEKKGFCSIECLVEMDRAKRSQSKEKEQRKRNADDKERIKSLSAICSEAQRDVNAMIRAVDEYHGHRCIATGQPISDCGHFYHAGSKYRISWMRFHHANLHGQGAKSNRYAGGGDALNYLKGLQVRYGQQYIDELEDFKLCQDQGLWPSPTREEVKAMAAWCRAMTRIYKKMQK